jgi:hypothetical protein
VDLAALAVRAALGLASDEEEVAPRRGPAGVVEFLRAPPGRLLAARARPPDGAEVHLYHRGGHRYGPLATAPDRAGYVLALGCTREDALERAGTAARSVIFATA